MSISPRFPAASKPKLATITSANTAVLQRQCDCGQHTGGGECEECKNKKGLLQRKSAGDVRDRRVPGIVHDVLRSSGQALDAQTRAFFEPRFGRDFSRVRVHADASAAESASAVNAAAYTVGQNVVFGAGRFAPTTRIGAWLLAHELAHTIQQQNSTHSLAKLALDSESNANEFAADSAADAVMSDGRVPALNTSSVMLQRKRIDRISDDERLIHNDDGSRRRVKRIRWNTTETGPANWVEAKPGIDRQRVWLEVEWCAGKNQGTVKIGADVPAQVINAAVKAVTSNGDVDSAIRGVKLTPFAQVNILQSGSFTVAANGQVTVDMHGKITGGEGSVSASKGPVEGSVSVGSTDVGGKQDVHVIVAGKVTLGKKTEAKDCQRQKSHVVDHTRFECQIEEDKKPGPPKPPQAQPQFVPLFYKYAEAAPLDLPEYNRSLDLIATRVAEGYTLGGIEGETSPEGPRSRPDLEDAGTKFTDNKRLAQARAKRAHDDLQKKLQDRLAQSAAAKLTMRQESRDQEQKRLRAALADIDKAAANVPAEMFGDKPGGEEIKEKALYPELQKQIGDPVPGQTDALEQQHVTGAGVAAEPRKKGERAAAEFRGGKASPKKRLQAVYGVFRRVLVTLKPPPPEVKVGPSAAAAAAASSNKPTPCTAEDEKLFDDSSAKKN